MKDRTDKPTDTFSSRLLQIIQDGLEAIVVTLIAGPGRVGAKMIVAPDGSHQGTLHNESLNQAVVLQALRFMNSGDETRAFFLRDFVPENSELSETQFLFELIQPEQRIVICGAGHVGASLAKLAALLGFRAILIDDRKEFLLPANYPYANIELTLAANWSDAASTAAGNGRGVSVAIVTRGHSEDEQCLRAVLSTSAPAYVGLIGSKRRTRIVLERLRASGVAEEKLKQVHAPIGLDIGAVTPEEVALAILAEIVAVRRGGKGGSLSASRR